MKYASLSKPVSLARNSILLSMTMFIPEPVVAAGFQLNAQSNAGLGRAFAGDAVIADNASSMSRNPATMALFKETSLSVGAIRLQSMVEVKEAVYTRELFSQGEKVSSTAFAANYDDAGSSVFAPNIHLVVPVSETLAFGINGYSNFGTQTEYDESYVAAEYAGKSEVKSYNLGLSASYRVNEQVSIGAGIDIIAATGKLERKIQPSHAKLLSIETDGWGLGFNLGAVYEFDENNRFGLSYRYSPEIETEGDIDYIGYTKESGPIDDKLFFPLPDMVEFSGYHQLESSKLALHYSIQWVGWKAFDKLTADKSGQICRYDWRDGWHFSVGGTYSLDDNWTLRTGYMFDTSAQHERTSISVPDSHRQFFSAGFTYRLTSKSNVDFGFTYLLGEDVKVTESKPVIPVDITTASYLSTRISATTHANALLMGLNYNRTF